MKKTKTNRKTRRFILTGDIRHPGKVAVEAASLAEALKKAEDCDFVVYDESGKHLVFDFCGDTRGGVEIVP